MAFFSGDLHPVYAPLLNPDRYTTQRDEAALASVKQAASVRLKMIFGILDGHLEGKDYLLAGRIAFVDSYAYVMTIWLHYADLDLSQFPNLRRHFDRLHNDPAVIQAENEGGDKKKREGDEEGE